MSVAATIFGSVSSTLVATVSSPAPSSASSTTAMFRLKRRMSVGSSRRGVVVDTIEDDNEIAEDVPIEGTIQVGRKLLDDENKYHARLYCTIISQDEKTLLHIPPATVEDLKSLFRKYAKSSSG